MSTPPSDRNLALFIDFDNVALGARDARMRFDCRLLLQRILEKGKVVVKRAYADWHHYKEHMTALHEAAIELIEVPMPRISGKNSADIRMVVDAIDLCYSKDHIDTFVLVSGDSDFSPLVSKLRENNKRVIGIGMRNSSSHLLISNCDEWIFYDDIYQTTVVKLSEKVASVPVDKRELFDFLLTTTQSLLQESRGMLYSSLIKDTMKRKQPDFNETNYGYATFGDLLEDMRDHGLLTVERDSRAGGTLVVLGLGKADVALTGRAKTRRSRRGGRDRDRNGASSSGTGAGAPQTAEPVAAVAETAAVAGPATDEPLPPAIETPVDPTDGQDAATVAAGGGTEQERSGRRSRRRSSRRRRSPRAESLTEAGEAGPAGEAPPLQRDVEPEPELELRPPHSLARPAAGQERPPAAPPPSADAEPAPGHTTRRKATAKKKAPASSGTAKKVAATTKKPAKKTATKRETKKSTGER